MSSTDEATVAEVEFLSLEVRQCGFVVYGIGPGAERCNFRGQSLSSFLHELWSEMGAVKEDLNKDWRQLNRQDPSGIGNSLIIRKFLYTASWAYALAIDLAPFTDACVYGPTNPLRHIFLERLEEIFTRCFVAAFIYGSPDESMIGLRGILTDFEVNGGIDLKTRECGRGFYVSLFKYFMACFVPSGREPIVYDKYAQLTEAIAALVTDHYPKVKLCLSKNIIDRLEDDRHGFANAFTSPAKIEMVARLKRLAEKLA